MSSGERIIFMLASTVSTRLLRSCGLVRRRCCFQCSSPPVHRCCSLSIFSKPILRFGRRTSWWPCIGICCFFFLETSSICRFREAVPQLDRCHNSPSVLGSFFRESLRSAWRVSLPHSCCVTCSSVRLSEQPPSCSLMPTRSWSERAANLVMDNTISSSKRRSSKVPPPSNVSSMILDNISCVAVN